jgi:hypothetical protein
MGGISMRNVVGLAVILIALMLMLFAMWFYVFVFSVEQAARIKQEQAHAMDDSLRAKYCTGGPYENEIVRRFCATKGK